jgi:hypothetical protein
MACCEAEEDVEDKIPSAMEPKEDEVLIGVLLIVLTMLALS